ncbi:hypothetical protein FBQ96_14325, partial [Nitrospirales bacterium NOB]|nr:hypothetical protein [Nitrospirales bacterium NOB]
MNIDRRSLMKGLLAGGALLTLGVPPWTFADQATRKPRQCLLLLGDSEVDDAFAGGVRAACVGLEYDGLRIVKVTGGLLSDANKMDLLLERFKEARWIAVMDDASAAVFQELARAAGGRLLSVGSHVGSEDGACPLRHTWLVASPAQSVGGLLAAQLAGPRAGFSITERFLSEPANGGQLVGWSAAGFSSYRLAASESMHLHCSGFSWSEGCGLLGLAEGEGWRPIPSQVCEREKISWQPDDWAQAVGYAAAASALGMNSVQESCSSRAFVHRAHGGGQVSARRQFVSLVMD